tara:strand:- start:335 stop:1243 length:909 start_codon:yes stop_codon:yes gene_type:complete
MAASRQALSSAYMDCLARNIPEANVPKEVDLVLDAGGITSLRTHGVLLYLDALIRAGKTKVRRVSTTSAGSVVGIAFLLRGATSLDTHQLLCEVLKSVRRKGDLSLLMDFLRTNLVAHVGEEQLKELNGRLFVTYKAPSSGRSRIVSTYSSANDLMETVQRAAHVPYLSDGGLFRKGKYCDGLTPTVFRDNRRPCLLVSPVQLFRWVDVFWASSPARAWALEMEGATDAHEFFFQGRSRFCSYCNLGWSFAYMRMCVREMIALVVVAVLCVLDEGSKRSSIVACAFARLRRFVAFCVRTLAR